MGKAEGNPNRADCGRRVLSGEGEGESFIIIIPIEEQEEEEEESMDGNGNLTKQGLSLLNLRK